MVLFTASRRNTFVGGTCALRSALLVTLSVYPHIIDFAERSSSYLAAIQPGMNYLSISDFLTLLTPSNAVWKFISTHIAYRARYHTCFLHHDSTNFSPPGDYRRFQITWLQTLWSLQNVSAMLIRRRTITIKKIRTVNGSWPASCSTSAS